MDDAIGKTYLGRFRVDEMLSTGEAFVRYRGFDLKRSLPLSIRVFNFLIPSDPAVLCFQQNNLTLQTIMHPNIIPFYGLYEAEGKSFAIEKFIEGPSLSQILRQRHGTPVPPQEALIYLKALASALEYIHGFGLVHATVSLANVNAARDGRVMLSNFGFARMIDNRMSDAGAYGPPFCQAPEQIKKEKVFPATDIYALGVIFFELLTGVHPFLLAPSSAVNDRAAIDQIRQGHLSQEPPDPRRFNPNLPAGLNDMLITSLAKNPRDRYQSAQEMMEIACAVLGTGPKQVPDRLGGGPPVSPTQVVPRGAPLPGPGVPPTAGAPSIRGGTQVAGPGYSGVPGTQVVPGQPAWQGQPGYAPPSGPPPNFPADQAERRRPPWLLPLIGLLVVAILLCVAVGVWAGMPIVQQVFGIASATPTLTSTPISTPTSTATQAPPTQPSLPTAPPAVQPTAPPAVQPTAPVVVPPTEPPPPTKPSPTEIPTPTTKKTAFKVTIQNNAGFPIYAFRDGSIMGTDPIPPGMYIYYLNIPAGVHRFNFCRDLQGQQCPFGKQADVQKDMTINVR